jgi:hypothetical protein
MPRKKAEKLTLKEKEKWFVSRYIEAGALPEHISACEKRTHLEPGSGRRILRRKTVQVEIQLRTEAVRNEQIRQAAVSQATKTSLAAHQEELRNAVTGVGLKKISLEVIDDQLMRGVIGLDWNTFPKEKLDAIKAAYVVFGTLESGNTRRLIPPEHLEQNQGKGTYASLFDRLALKPQPEGTPAPQPPAAQEVFDLIPGVKQPEAVYAAPMPPPGESIDEPAPARKTDSRIMTVEVE